MRRWHLAELHEFPWCPGWLRDGLTDFLEAQTRSRDLYGAIRGDLLAAIQASSATRVVDLCSGGGGPWVHWQQSGKTALPVLLTDRFPSGSAPDAPRVDYCREPVDATTVPPGITGFRTLFTAFHHFSPPAARSILRDAIDHRQPIGVFEFTTRTWGAVFFMLLSPFAVWMVTPRMRNLTWRKLLFTYLIPLIPLLITIDGVVSSLRTYTLDELRDMAGPGDYIWLAGERRTPGWPLPITYFIGYPPKRPMGDSGDGMVA